MDLIQFPSPRTSSSQPVEEPNPADRTKPRHWLVIDPKEAEVGRRTFADAFPELAIIDLQTFVTVNARFKARQEASGTKPDRALIPGKPA